VRFVNHRLFIVVRPIGTLHSAQFDDCREHQARPQSRREKTSIVTPHSATSVRIISPAPPIVDASTSNSHLRHAAGLAHCKCRRRTCATASPKPDVDIKSPRSMRRLHRHKPVKPITDGVAPSIRVSLRRVSDMTGRDESLRDLSPTRWNISQDVFVRFNAISRIEGARTSLVEGAVANARPKSQSCTSVFTRVSICRTSNATPFGFDGLTLEQIPSDDPFGATVSVRPLRLAHVSGGAEHDRNCLLVTTE